MTAAPHPIGASEPSFVGRGRELAWLRSLLDEAADGQARLALIGGEPGVGKTRLVREFLVTADGLGWQTVWGHCSLDAGGPHLPFATGLVARMERAGLLSQEDTDAIWRGEDFPMVAARLAERTLALAARRPVVFVIDDYQFGELSTLRLIGEYARQITEISRRELLPLLLLITHHPPLEGDAFGETLERLQREPIARPLSLSGLRELEVYELVREIFSNDCDPKLLHTLQEATGGNPFFVVEVLRHLERRQMLRVVGGYLAVVGEARESPLTLTISRSLADRLQSVDRAVLALVQVGAILGDTFELEDAGLVLGADGLEEVADRAAALGLLEQSGAGLAFTHGMVRTAAGESIGPLRRKRLHAEAARSLLGRHGAASDHAVEIARHVLAAGSWPDAAEAGEIYVRASDLALDSFAWATAQQFFEATLELKEFVAGLSDREVGWLKSKAARANGNNGDHSRARELYHAAMGHFRACRDLEGWGLALLGWWRTFSSRSEEPPESGEYEEFLSAAGNDALDVRCQLLTHRAEMLWARRDPADLEVGAQAFALSRESSDPQTRAYGSVTYGLVLNRHLQPREALAMFQLSAGEADETGNPRLQGWGRARASLPMILQGDLAAARAACEDERELARRGNDLSNGPLNLAVFHAAAVLNGDFDLAGQLRIEGANYGRRASYPAASFILDSGVAWERLMRGEFQEAIDALDSWDRAGGAGVSQAMRMLTSARRGHLDQVRSAVTATPVVVGRGGVDFSNIGAIAVAAELADELEDPLLAKRTLDLLNPLVAAGGVCFSVTPPILLVRSAAVAARACGDVRLARELIAQAADVAARAAARPEAGLVALERAKLLHATGAPTREIERAMSESAEIFRTLDMAGAALQLFDLAARSGISSRVIGPSSSQAEASGVELEVIQGLARGESPEQIAESLLISNRSVRAHLSRIERRLRVSDGASARRYLAADGPQAGAAPEPQLRELTAREREVLALIARGLTNQQIADELVISLHTAIRHVANILGKTGAANRTEAALLIRPA